MISEYETESHGAHGLDMCILSVCPKLWFLTVEIRETKAVVKDGLLNNAEANPYTTEVESARRRLEVVAEAVLGAAQVIRNLYDGNVRVFIELVDRAQADYPKAALEGRREHHDIFVFEDDAIVGVGAWFGVPVFGADLNIEHCSFYGAGIGSGVIRVSDGIPDNDGDDRGGR